MATSNNERVTISLWHTDENVAHIFGLPGAVLVLSSLLEMGQSFSGLPYVTVDGRMVAKSCTNILHQNVPK